MRKLTVGLALFFYLFPAYTLANGTKADSGIKEYFKSHEMDVFPVPVWESRPDKGNTYGLMPVILLSDSQSHAIEAIFAVIGQYNSVTKFDGAALAYFYPEPEREILFYAEAAQKYTREFSFRFFDPHFYEKFFLESDVKFLKTPFGHFFGIGSKRQEKNRSNYTARYFNMDLTGGYYFFKNFRANYTFRYHTTDLLNRAMEEFDDTLTRYGGLPNVVDATNLIHEISVVYDSRPAREYSEQGSMARLKYFGSAKKLGSDKTFQGWGFETLHLFKTYRDKMVTALRFEFAEVFGNRTPFYELSSLGGPSQMRAFTPLRFVDQGKMALQVEERVKILSWKVYGIPFEIHADPFVEVGRVFDAVSHLGFDDWQFVGGLGIRAFVPPNVVGRIDMAFGSDGFEVYTALGYPF